MLKFPESKVQERLKAVLGDNLQRRHLNAVQVSRLGLQTGQAPRQQGHCWESQFSVICRSNIATTWEWIFQLAFRITAVVNKLQRLFEDLLAVTFKSESVQCVPSLHWKCKWATVILHPNLNFPQALDSAFQVVPKSAEPSNVHKAKLSLFAAAMKQEEMLGVLFC